MSVSVTKLYLHNVAAAYTPPTIRGTWQYTANAVTKRLDASPESGGNRAMVQGRDTGANPEIELLYRGISGPLAAQTISGNFDLMIATGNPFGGATYHYIYVYVTQGDTDTPRGVLIANYFDTLVASRWVSTTFTALDGPQAISLAGVQAGDRLVCELGSRMTHGIGNSRFPQLHYGTKDIATHGGGHFAPAATTETAMLNSAGYLMGSPVVTFSAGLLLADTDSRLSQITTETLTQPTPPVRLSQVVAETMTQVGSTIRVSQMVVETLSGTIPPETGWPVLEQKYSANGTNVTSRAITFTPVGNLAVILVSRHAVGAASLPTVITSNRWRIYITTSYGGGNCTIAEMEMASSAGGTDLCVGGTASADSIYDGTLPAAGAFDDNNTTRWNNNLASSPTWLEYQFVSPVTIREYRVRCSSDPAAAPQVWQFQYWDGSGWVTVDTRSVAAWSSSQVRTFGGVSATVAPSTRWRVYVTTANGNNCSIGEVEMAGSVAGADLCTGGTAVSQSDYSGSYDAAKAFDDNVATRWNNNNSSMPTWIEYQFASAVTILEYRLRSGDLPSGMPAAWQLQYWNGSVWVTVDTRAGIATWSTSELRTYVVSSMPDAAPPGVLSGTIAVASGVGAYTLKAEEGGVGESVHLSAWGRAVTPGVSTTVTVTVSVACDLTVEALDVSNGDENFDVVADTRGVQPSALVPLPTTTGAKRLIVGAVTQSAIPVVLTHAPLELLINATPVVVLSHAPLDVFQIGGATTTPVYVYQAPLDVWNGPNAGVQNAQSVIEAMVQPNAPAQLSQSVIEVLIETIPPPPPLTTTSYANAEGTGNRMASILLSSVGMTGTLSALVDGNVTSTANYFNVATGCIVEFWFPSKKILNEAKFYQQSATAQGDWRWEGSNDRTTWTVIGDVFTLGSATQTLTSMLYNQNAYVYYRMKQMGGSTNGGPWTHEWEFKLVEAGTTSYLNPLGRGNRTATITVTSGGGISMGGTIGNLVNGLIDAAAWFNDAAAAGHWLQFDLGAAYVMQEARFWLGVTAGQGVWKFQGSTDASSWVDLSGEVTLGLVTPTPFCFASNTTAYRYYRMLGVSGSHTSGPYLHEWEFMVAATGPVFISRAQSTVITTGASSKTTTAAAHPAGRLLVVCMSLQSNTAVTVADTAGNTWTEIGITALQGTNRIRMFYAYNSLAHAANVITATLASGTANYWALSVQEFSGNWAGGAPTVSTGSANGAGSTATTSTIDIPGTTAAVYVAMAMGGNGSGGLTSTQLVAINFGGTNGGFFADGHDIDATDQAVTFTWPGSPGAVLVAAFTPS